MKTVKFLISFLVCDYVLFGLSMMYCVSGKFPRFSSAEQSFRENYPLIRYKYGILLSQHQGGGVTAAQYNNIKTSKETHSAFIHQL